jgi:hypothetical protein
MRLSRLIGALLLLLLLALFIVLFLIPALRPAPAQGIYSEEYQSTVTQNVSETTFAAVRGQVKNAQGRGIPALVRIYNARRSRYQIDIAAQQYTDLHGNFTLQLTPGEYELLVNKGPEYEYLFVPFSVSDKQTVSFDIGLERIVNMAELGWFAGDPHQHSGFKDGKDPLPQLLLANVALGLHFSAQTDHNVVGQNPLAKAWATDVALDSDSGFPFHVIGGDEISTSIGHMIVWEPKDDTGSYIHVDHDAPQPEASLDSKIEALTRINKDARRYGQFVNINHPAGGNVAYENFGEKRGDSFMDVDFDWVANREHVLAFDATETWNGGSGFMESMYYFGSGIVHPFEGMERVFHEWFRLLNTGAKFPSLGSSDTHDASVQGAIDDFHKLVNGVKDIFFGQLPYIPPKIAFPLFGDNVEAALMYQELDAIEYALEEVALLPGTARTYVYTGGELSTKALIDNIGHSFITSGPLLLADIDGAMPGQTARISGRNTLNLAIKSHKPLRKLLVIADGELLLQRQYDDVMQIQEQIALDLDGKRWAMVYVEGHKNYAYAFTNPIYLDASPTD